MATKTLTSINITLFPNIDSTAPVSIATADTADRPLATNALEQFKQKKTMYFEGQYQKYYIIPFHSVAYIQVMGNETEVPDKPNPYDCYPSDTVCGAKVVC